MTIATAEKDRVRTDQSALLEALKAAGINVDNPKKLRCVWHEDENPSAGVYQREDGAWAFKCHGCNLNMDVYDVLARVENKPIGEVLPSEKTKSEAKPDRLYPEIADIEATLHHRTDTFTYTNPTTGRADMVVFRLQPPGDKKTFLQASPRPGGFVLRKPEGKWPLYNRARVATKPEVIVVEGEKCVHALHRLGIVATTSPGGSKNADKADWSPLAGKIAYLWRDNDDNGAGYMRDVAAQLQSLMPACKVHQIAIEPMSLPAGGDVVEFLAAVAGDDQAKRQAVADVLAKAAPMTPSEEVKGRLTAMIRGEYYAVPWVGPILSRLTKALFPGTGTMISGTPGSAKTFFVLDVLGFWQANGIKAAMVPLEEDRTHFMHRLLAQLDDNSNLLDDDWVREHPDEALESHARHESVLNEIGERVFANHGRVTLSSLYDTIDGYAANGFRVIVVDPITAAKRGQHSWLEDDDFVNNIAESMRKHGSSLVMVTHPKKGSGRSGSSEMDDMALGAAYQRFTQTVIWLTKPEEQQCNVLISNSAHVTTTVTANRRLQIRKTRNGPGSGLELAYHFDPRTLKFAEQGIVKEEE